ncbi:MAG TPA: hypothetical protein VGG72_30140 [Bryobacteraceae bacterium]|jgi:hypothetical protein
MVPPKTRLIVVVLAGAVVFASALLGQRVISAKAGLLCFVQGRASVEGGALSTGEHFRQLKNGESLATERGRAEVLLNPGTFLRVGDMSRVHMDDIKLTDACVSLDSGSAVVTVNYILKTDRLRLIAGGSVIVMKQPGVYRLDASTGRLRVFNGKAEVRRDGGSAYVIVKRGQVVDLTGLKLAKFDIKDTDALQRWAAARSRAPFPRGLRPVPPKISWDKTDAPPASSAGKSNSSGQF